MGLFRHSKRGLPVSIPARGLLAWAIVVALASTLAQTSEPAQSALAGEGTGGDPTRLGAGPARPPSPFDLGPALRARGLRGLRPEVVSRILTTPEGGQLPIEALALPLGDGAVALLVEIDGASFLQYNQSDMARLEIYAYALGPGGRVAGYLAEVFAVDVQKLGERIWQGGLKLYGGLEVPAGSYDLRILARNYDSGASGLRRIRVEVPPTVTGDAVMLPPIFASPRRDAWLPVRGSRSGQADLFADYPLVAGDRAITPEALPVLVAGRETVCYLFASKLPDGSLRGALEFLLEDPESPILGSSRIETRDLGGTGEGGLEAREIRFTPPELPPGPYSVRLRWEGDTQSGGFSSTAPVELVGSDTRERDLLWSDLRWLIRGREAPRTLQPSAVNERREPAPVEKERVGRAARLLAGRYRNVLGLLRDDPQAARVALFELESEVLARGETTAIRRLTKAELAVAEELADQHVEALVPIVVLHGEMVRLYRGRRLYFLVSHSSSMVEFLAERISKLGGSPEVSAGVLSSEAGYLQEANLPASSRRLFWRALEADPATPAALLGLAVSFEKYGEYSAAVEVLERLVGIAPKIDEGLLRLGVNLARVGRLTQSREILREVVDRSAGDWVCAVANQELARSYLTSGDAESAAELLEPVAARMVDRPGLRLLLAHIYDRLGRTQASLEQLLLIRPQTSDHPVSARQLYDQWPRSILETTRQRLYDAAARTNEVLARALATDSQAREGEGG